MRGALIKPEMPRRQTPTERVAYEETRALARTTYARYSKSAPGQKELADFAGVTQAMVSRVLNGSTVSVETLERLAQRLFLMRLADDDLALLRAALARYRTVFKRRPLK